MSAPLGWYSMVTGASWSETTALPGIETQFAMTDDVCWLVVWLTMRGSLNDVSDSRGGLAVENTYFSVGIWDGGVIDVWFDCFLKQQSWEKGFLSIPKGVERPILDSFFGPQESHIWYFTHPVMLFALTLSAIPRSPRNIMIIDASAIVWCFV